jgi:hypothetical protein
MSDCQVDQFVVDDTLVCESGKPVLGYFNITRQFIYLEEYPMAKSTHKY